MLVYLLRLAHTAHKMHPIAVMNMGIAAMEIRGSSRPEENRKS